MKESGRERGEIGGGVFQFSKFTSKDYKVLREKLLGDPEGPEFPKLDLERLVKEIARGNTVAFVGAGASANAGYKTWWRLLRTLLDEARNIMPSSVYKWAEEHLNGGDFLLVAELLEDLLGENHLGERVFEEFGDSMPRPTPIDIEIARIPFAGIVTTNYDRLLEQSREGGYIATWQRPNALLDVLRSDLGKSDRVVFKIHGDVDDLPSIVLGTSRYREVIANSPSLRGVLKTLFLTHTVLFVGFGFSDPHIRGILDELIMEYGKRNVGPHYAIFSSREAPIEIATLLNKLYNIRVLNYHVDDKFPEFESLGRSLDYGEQMTAGTKLMLNEIGGLVAKRIGAKNIEIIPGSRYFSFYQAVKKLLEELKSVTGSFRTDFVLFDGGEQVPYVWASHGSIESEVLNSPALQVNSVCWKAYYQIKPDEVLNIPNVDSATRKVGDNCKGDPVIEERLGQIKYVVGHTDVRCEMATPVYSDGNRIGVLNAESRQYNAYSIHHEQSLLEFANLCGAFWSSASSMQQRANVLESLNNSQELLNNKGKNGNEKNRTVLKFHQCLRTVSENFDKLQFLLYKADYIEGVLGGIASSKKPISEYEKKNKAQRPLRLADVQSYLITFDFDYLESFAVRVFNTKRIHYYPDALERDDAGLDSDSRKRFEITGPILGVPLMIRKVCVGVLILWIPDGHRISPYEVQLVSRLTHCILNRLAEPDGKRALSNLEEVYWLLRRVNQIKSHSISLTQVWEEILPDVLEKARLRRLRIYVKEEIEDKRGNYDRHHLFKSGEIRKGLYRHTSGISRNWKDIKVNIPPFQPQKIFTSAKNNRRNGNEPRYDPYLEHLYIRVKGDPYTKKQPASLFGEDESIRKKLGKEANQPWYTTPLLCYSDNDTVENDESGLVLDENYREEGMYKNSALAGYLVTDNHQKGHLNDLDTNGRAPYAEHLLDILAVPLANCLSKEKAGIV